MTQLLLLTGSRHEEIDGLRWSEVDLEKAATAPTTARCKSRSP